MIDQIIESLIVSGACIAATAPIIAIFVMIARGPRENRR